MKKMYMSPEVEILDVMVEQGFAASGFGDENYDGNSNGENLPDF